MPFSIQRRAGGWFRAIQPPPFITYAGPWFAYPEQKEFKLNSRYAFEKRTLGTLLTQLPPTDYTVFQCAPEVQNGLAFHWAGYRLSVRYTYLMPPAEDDISLENGFKNTVRTDLKTAAEKVQVMRDDTAAIDIFSLYQASLRRKGRSSDALQERFFRLHNALQERRQSACFLAKSLENGQPVAGIYLVFDHQRAGLLMNGVHPEALALRGIFPVILEAIRFCSARGLTLDFEGSMDEGMEHFFRAFGARQQPYLRVWRTANRWIEAARWIWMGRD